VRKDIETAFNDFNADNVVVRFVGTPVPRDQYQTLYHELMNTTFALVPAGHWRWSYRFSEAVESCAIPVIMADGLTLPWEDIVDWNEAAVILNEDDAKSSLIGHGRGSARGGHEGGGAHRLSAQDRMTQLLLNPRKLLDKLPHDPQVIQKMRNKVCEISRLFGPIQRRAQVMLVDAAQYVSHRHPR